MFASNEEMQGDGDSTAWGCGSRMPVSSISTRQMAKGQAMGQRSSRAYSLAHLFTQLCIYLHDLLTHFIPVTQIQRFSQSRDSERADWGLTPSAEDGLSVSKIGQCPLPSRL